MARKSTARPAEELNALDNTINHEELAQAGQDLAEKAQRLTVIDQQYGMDMPYNLELYKVRIRTNVAETAQRLIEIGVMLIQIREREMHGTFLKTLDDVGMGARFAQRAMQTAAKMHGLPKLQTLGVSKALELLTEDDDDLAQLEQGGTLAGLTLDEIDTMSVRELKAALRAERAEREDEKAADEEIIRAKDERINKLTRDKRKGSSENAVRARADELLRDADEAVVEAASQLAKLRQLHQDVETLYSDAGLTVDAEVDTRLEGNLSWAAEQLRTIAEHLGE